MHELEILAGSVEFCPILGGENRDRTTRCRIAKKRATILEAKLEGY